ncbi:MAG TPA: serine/threonine-protein kinase, partial [Byssovorax sp.]
ARHALLSLAEAHEKGIIHRDLKPDNLFLTPASAAHDVEICKVLDFGIAKVVTDAPAAVDALETQAGTVFGTPRYMSPEQAQGKALDARSDLYALGVLLYQMLVGRAPFVDDDAVVVMARHIKTLPVAPSAAAPEAAIPRALSDVVMRALMKDPGDRPATARAFVAELDDAIGRARSDRPPPRGAAAVASGALAALSRDDLDTASDDQRRHRRRRALAWASAGAALAVAAFGFALTSLHGVATSPAEVGLASEAAKDAARAADMTRAVAAAAAPASAPPIAEAASASATASAATPPPAVHQSAPAQPQQKRAQHYKRFDQ